MQGTSLLKEIGGSGQDQHWWQGSLDYTPFQELYLVACPEYQKIPFWSQSFNPSSVWDASVPAHLCEPCISASVVSCLGAYLSRKLSLLSRLYYLRWSLLTESQEFFPGLYLLSMSQVAWQQLMLASFITTLYVRQVFCVIISVRCFPLNYFFKF